MLNLAYPWWLMAAVVVVAVLLWYALAGWERPWAVAPLVFVLTPVCVLAAVAVAMALSLALTEPLEPPPPPARIEVSNLTTTPERTGSATTARPASPAASS